MAIGITVDFNANIARFSTQLDQLSNNIARFQQRTESMSNRVNGALSSIGLGVSTAGIAAFVKSGIDAADAFNDLSDRTGIAVEELAGLQLAAKLGDTDMQSLATSVNKLSVNIANNREEFAKLGITAKDPIEAFYQLADIFSSIQDPQEQAAFGAKALGKAYAEMEVLLKQGGAALRDQVEQGKKYSGITEENAKKAGAFNDKLDILANRSIGFRSKFALGILEPLVAIGEEIDRVASKSATLGGVLEGIAYGYQKFSVSATEGLVDQQLHDLNVRIVVAKGILKEKQEGGFFGKNSADEIAAQTSLNALLKEREELVSKLAKKPENEPAKYTNNTDLYRAAEKKYNLPPYLVQAVANAESSGGLNAGLSPAGALGVMQLMPDTAKALGVTDRADPAQSIEGGAKLLRELLDRYNGNLNLAIAAYNSSPSAVKAAGGIPSNPETQAYIPKVLAELDKLQNNTRGVSLVDQLKTFQDFIKNQREAVGTLNASHIDNKLKLTEMAADDVMERLKVLKEQGKIGISEYYQALTAQQEYVVRANIEAVKARLVEADRLSAQAKASAKPEELPKLAADIEAKKAALNTELQGFELKLQQIQPANLIDKNREQKQLDDVVNQVKAKLAELRGETGRDPVAIKLRLELENADIIAKLKQAGQGGLADQYINSLSATEQAGVIQADIGKVQQRTQAQENRINLLQQSGTISQFHAQQQLKQLYKESADQLDIMAEKMTALGDNTGLEEVKVKALEAKNAAGQLRVALPDLGRQFIDAGQSAAISSLTDGLVGLTSGAKSAGQAFTDMGLSVVKAIQAIAAEQLAKQIIGGVISLAGSAFSGSVTGGGTDAGINTSNTGISNSIDAFLPRAGGGYIQGPGTETSDSIHTTLPAGSFVIKAASVKKLGLPALERLMQGAADSAASAQVPVRLSNREYAVLPDMVKKYGRDFWQHLNDIGSFPPMSIQRAYAGGGLVGGTSASASVVQPGAGDAITINVPVTINQPENKSGPDNGKLDPAAINALGKRFKAIVAEEIAQQQRPGGLLYGRR